MSPLPSFRSVFFLILLISLTGAASAVTVSFSDFNLVSRNIEIYEISENGTTLSSSGITNNATFHLNPDCEYQIIVKPSKFSWFDDPRDTFDYIVNTAAGQSIAFLFIFLIFGGLVRLICRR